MLDRYHETVSEFPLDMVDSYDTQTRVTRSEIADVNGVNFHVIIMTLLTVYRKTKANVQ